MDRKIDQVLSGLWASASNTIILDRILIGASFSISQVLGSSIRSTLKGNLNHLYLRLICFVLLVVVPPPKHLRCYFANSPSLSRSWNRNHWSLGEPRGRCWFLITTWAKVVSSAQLGEYSASRSLPSADGGSNFWKTEWVDMRNWLNSSFHSLSRFYCPSLSVNVSWKMLSFFCLRGQVKEEISSGYCWKRNVQSLSATECVGDGGRRGRSCSMACHCVAEAPALRW